MAFSGTDMPRDGELARLKRQLGQVGFSARSGDALCQRIILRFQLIERYRQEFSVRLMCHCLRVSTSATTAEQEFAQRLPASACLV